MTVPTPRLQHPAVRSALATLLVSIAVAIINLPSLLRPMPTGDACGTVRPFIGPFTRFQNCDSPVFNLIAADFSQLFTQAGETRMGRPVFLAAGWLMDRLVFAASFGTIDPTDATAPLYERAEVGYVLLNIVLVSVAVVLAWRLTVGRDWYQPKTLRNQWPIAGLVFLFLAANPLTKAFLWTSHTQMLVILVPVLALMAGRWALTTKPTHRRIVIVGLAIGLGILAYASSVVIALVAATAFTFRRRLAATAMLLAGAAALPVLWVTGVRVLHGSFYSVETEKFRQFVWVFDGLRDGTLLQLLRANIDDFLRSFFEGQTLLALAIVIIVLGSVAFGSRIAPVAAQGGLRPLAFSVALTAAWFVLFLYAMGFYQTRLTWSLIITLLLAALILLANTFISANPRQRRLLTVGSAAIAGAWYVVWLAIPEPWF